MITIDANKTHPGVTIRLALTFSILKREPIKIINIKTENEKTGLTYEDFIYVKILEQIAGAESKGIEKASTEIEFIPKTLKNAPQINFRHPALVSVMLPYLLLLYHNTTQKISLTGPTNYENKLSVDYFQNVIIPLLKKINVAASIEITKRGYGEEPGKIILYTKESNRLRPFSMLEKGDLEHSVIYIHSYGHSESVNSYIIEGLKNTLTPKNILINDYKSTFVENREKHKGYGADVVLLYDNTVLGANVCSTKKQPSQLGKELADKIISLVARVTPLDTHAANMIIPFLAYYNLNAKIIYPKKDDYLDDCLYICETLLGTKYTKEEREKDIYLELNP